MQATRRTAREWTIQMLTAADLNPPDDIPTFIQGFWEQLASIDIEEGGKGKLPRAAYVKFTEERVVGVLNAQKELDDILVPIMENWDLYRLGTVERAVLRMGIWELKYTDIPKPVVINEAVDIANWFSTPKSRQFVNGILDKFAKTLERE